MGFPVTVNDRKSRQIVRELTVEKPVTSFPVDLSFMVLVIRKGYYRTDDDGGNSNIPVHVMGVVEGDTGLGLGPRHQRNMIVVFRCLLLQQKLKDGCCCCCC